MRFAVIAAVSCSVVGLAVAADAKASIKTPVDIPAEPLDLALKTLAKDRGFQMVFRTEVVGSVRTRGAHGQLTTSEALSKLLEGTHLSYAYLDENTVTITPVDLKTGAATSPDGVADSGDTKNSDTSEGQKSGSFLLAQVAQGGTPDSSAVGKENDQTSSKDEKKSEELEQIVVTGTPIHGVCALLCARDARFFDLVLLWGRTRMPSYFTTFRFWHAASYSPLVLDLPNRIGRRRVVSVELVLPRRRR